jgi:hypothetical protein
VWSPAEVGPVSELFDWLRPRGELGPRGLAQSLCQSGWRARGRSITVEPGSPAHETWPFGETSFGGASMGLPSFSAPDASVPALSPLLLKTRGGWRSHVDHYLCMPSHSPCPAFSAPDASVPALSPLLLKTRGGWRSHVDHYLCMPSHSPSVVIW